MVRRFIRYYRPHIKLFIIDMFCALGVSVIDLVFPLVTSKALREFIPDANLRMLFVAGAVLVVIYGVRFFLSYVIGYWGHVWASESKPTCAVTFQKFQTSISSSMTTRRRAN